MTMTGQRTRIDYLAIGHVCQDVTPGGPRLGGTVTFAVLTVAALGLKPGIVTSAPGSLAALMAPLDGLPLVCVPSQAPTTFENMYTATGRVQRLAGRAAQLRYEHIPPAWRHAPVVHLAPVADEVAPSLAARFPRVCVTPQGWMRRWDETGRVVYRPWSDAAAVLAHTQAVVFSIEDVQGDEALVQDYAQQTPVLVVTRGALGCTVFISGRAHHIPAPAVDEIDPTGAGDVFAASFFIRLSQVGDPLAAARFASYLASRSVAFEGLASIPDTAAVRTALAEA